MDNGSSQAPPLHCTALHWTAVLCARGRALLLLLLLHKSPRPPRPPLSSSSWFLPYSLHHSRASLTLLLRRTTLSLSLSLFLCFYFLIFFPVERRRDVHWLVCLHFSFLFFLPSLVHLWSIMLSREFLLFHCDFSSCTFSQISLSLLSPAPFEIAFFAFFFWSSIATWKRY